MLKLFEKKIERVAASKRRDEERPTAAQLAQTIGSNGEHPSPNVARGSSAPAPKRLRASFASVAHVRARWICYGCRASNEDGEEYCKDCGGESSVAIGEVTVPIPVAEDMGPAPPLPEDAPQEVNPSEKNLASFGISTPPESDDDDAEAEIDDDDSLMIHTIVERSIA